MLEFLWLFPTNVFSVWVDNRQVYWVCSLKCTQRGGFGICIPVMTCACPLCELMWRFPRVAPPSRQPAFSFLELTNVQPSTYHSFLAYSSPYTYLSFSPCHLPSAACCLHASLFLQPVLVSWLQIYNSTATSRPWRSHHHFLYGKPRQNFTPHRLTPAGGWEATNNQGTLVARNIVYRSVSQSTLYSFAISVRDTRFHLLATLVRGLVSLLCFIM